MKTLTPSERHALQKKIQAVTGDTPFEGPLPECFINYWGDAVKVVYHFVATDQALLLKMTVMAHSSHNEHSLYTFSLN